MLFLHCLGFAEGAFGLRQAPDLKKRIGKHRTLAHALEWLATPVGEFDAVLRLLERGRGVSQSEEKLADVPRTACRVLPVFARNSLLQRSAQWRLGFA